MPGGLTMGCCGWLLCLLGWWSCSALGEELLALRPPQDPPRPAVQQAEWCQGELDRLVLAPMEQAGLHPSAPAQPAVLLRRLSLDLTGLPPTPAEYAAFVAAPTAGAYGATVDRLLASPHFGERWAAPWLDLARYADTQGYEKDNLRTIWPYRDWVIRALNEDLPFDRFTIEQLAGDLLPQASEAQVIATAFHRNTMTNTEGGSDPEEFRYRAVIDRVNTTGTVWMGLTLGCAQCHDHPSLPISQREYFQLFAFFNQTADANENDDRPLLTVGDAALPVMRETLVKRSTFVARRGNWLDPGEEVHPQIPAALRRFGAEPDAGGTADLTRLDLAQWLVSAKNPLAARVTVNRYWEQLFGRGLVETVEDLSGAPADNPALLDWLAVRFAGDWKWSVKRLLREIVLSATYRQSSSASAEAWRRDPQNRWLARGARFRLPAETIRDQALSVAGLLSAKMYGRSVMPPQPEGIWQVVYNIQRWVPARGEDRYRRALYTFWRRTSPYPALALLDTPSRESCTARRARSDTPLAALALLNEPALFEAAQALGRRMREEGGGEPAASVRFGWKLLFGAEPSANSLRTLVALLAGKDDGYTVVANTLLNLEEALMHE